MDSSATNKAQWKWVGNKTGSVTHADKRRYHCRLQRFEWQCHSKVGRRDSLLLFFQKLTGYLCKHEGASGRLLRALLTVWLKLIFFQSLYLIFKIEVWGKKERRRSTNSCPTLVIPWTVACQVPLSMGFSRQEYWSGLPLPSPGELSDPGIEPRVPTLQADTLPTELCRKHR